MDRLPVLSERTDQVRARAIRVAMIGQKGYPPIHGGIEKHVAELAARLGAFGVEVHIYSRPHYSDSDGPTDLPGVIVHKLPSIATKHLDAISHTIGATLHSLGRSYDIVHYHALGPGLLAGLPRFLGSARTVTTVHGLDWQREKWGKVARRVLRLGETGCVRLPNRTIVVSKALRDHFRRSHSHETVYIPNGIAAPVLREPDLMRARGITGPYCLFVGRLVPEKGCLLLLEAWRRLPEAVRNSRQLVIAGDAGFTPGYVETLKRVAPAGVVFLGYVHGPILDELYTNTTLLILPSTLEGLSITLLEGMSYARCCLVSDIPPNCEAGADCARYFASGDAADLARKLEDLLGDSQQRQRLGEAAQQHVMRNYAWERVTESTAALYHEIVENSI